MLRTTHTYAVLDISQAAFDEIHRKLAAAGYQHAFHDKDDGRLVIDMHGIAVRGERPTTVAVATDHDPNLHPLVTRVNYEPENDKPGLKLAVDEIVTGPVDMVHLERMDDNCYWMSINKDGERQIVTFGARGKIVARTERE